MNRREILKSAAAVSVLGAHAAASAVDAVNVVQLPPPQLDLEVPLMQALKNRRSQREFGERGLSPQILSNLLWAAFGVNRPQAGMRTAPSAHNSQEIELYLALPEGLYWYEHKSHALQLVKALDVRARTGMQDFTGKAPLNIIYVADLKRMGIGAMDDKIMYCAADAGFISQNVYLYCAAAGLATVVRGWVDRSSLAKAMGLKADHRIVLAQTVGYPAV